MTQKTYKICLIGEAGCGKTTYVSRLFKDTFREEYVPTLGVEVFPFMVETSIGSVTFNLWDTAGDERFKGLGDRYYGSADAAIIFFDATSETSYNAIQTHIASFRRVCPNAPIVVVANKMDEKNARYGMNDNEHKQIPISIKSNLNVFAPLLRILRILNKNRHATITTITTRVEYMHVLRMIRALQHA